MLTQKQRNTYAAWRALGKAALVSLSAARRGITPCCNEHYVQSVRLAGVLADAQQHYPMWAESNDDLSLHRRARLHWRICYSAARRHVSQVWVHNGRYWA